MYPLYKSRSLWIDDTLKERNMEGVVKVGESRANMPTQEACLPGMWRKERAEGLHGIPGERSRRGCHAACQE